MINSALEYLAKQMGNVIRYDEKGNPGWYVPFYKCKSSDLDPSLPGHTHPAFVVNGEEIECRLIGKYMACEIPGGGSTLYSVPGMPPRVNMNYDDHLARIRAFAPGSSGITIADHGLILLMAKKLGWKEPHGNNSYGVDYRDGTRFEFEKSVKTGNKMVYRGWEYECLKDHTTGKDHLPEVDKEYWKPTGRHLGGVMVEGQQVDGNWMNGYNTLTGSGPNSWCLNHDPANLVDIQGNAFEEVYGYRIYDGELQIMKDNDAADPKADFSSGSAAWRAIMPNKSDETYTLVNPGTSGTLHWDKDGSKPKLNTACTGRTTGDESLGCQFKELTADASSVPHIPTILRELGIFPIEGDQTQGYTWLRNHANTEYMARRGGYCINTSNAGLGCLHVNFPRSGVSAHYGARGCFLDS